MTATILLICTVLAAGPGSGEEAAAQATYEQRVKAVFLYEFANYLTWPEGSDSGPFVIAVLGESGILAPLEEIADKRTLGERPIVVRPIGIGHEIGDCHVLFISAAADEEPEDILRALAGRPTLTVSEREGFAARGVAINFVLVSGRVKFEINRGALERAGIRSSSKLLNLARLVDDQGGGSQDHE
jgi:hypothetical protein